MLAITFSNIMLDFSLNVKGHVEASLFQFVYFSILLLENMARKYEEVGNKYIVMSLRQCCLHKDLQI